MAAAAALRLLASAALAMRCAHAKWPVLSAKDGADFAANKNPPPAPTHAIDAGLPRDFSWRRVAGHGALLVPSMNQHVPQYCGACFAFGAAHALMDRVKIARTIALTTGAPHAFLGPDLVVAVQVLLNCGGSDEGWGVAGSCALGGSAPSVYRWAERFGGWPTQGCFPYLATDGLGCRPDTICRNCMPMGAGEYDDDGSTACWAVPGDRADDPQCAGDATCHTNPYPRIAVGDHGALPSSEDVGPEAAALAMQLEIARGGPVTCNVDADPMLAYTGAGLTAASPPKGRGANDTDHVIEVVGWGVDDDGVDYWEIRNSWGEYFGDDGFAKVRRGVNDALIETGCTWVHPSGWGVPGAAWQTFALGEHDAAVADLVARHHASRPWSLEPAAGGWTYLDAGLVVLALCLVAAALFAQPVVSKVRESERRRMAETASADRLAPDPSEGFRAA